MSPAPRHSPDSRPAAVVPLAVWAPTARRVRVRLGPPEPMPDLTRPDVTVHDLTAADGGWWQLDVPRPAAGTLDYAFLLDDDPQPLPDPRSAWQPYGVHGPSRWLERRDLGFTDVHWPGPQGGAGVLGGVHYEVHIGTFTPEGSFDAAIARLPHLVELGVDVVALMPVAAFPGRWGWGYDGVHPYAVHDPYGGPHGLVRFVDACHAVGLGVSLDVVYNHLGPVGNYLPRFGPYFSTRHTTPWGGALDLDGPDAGPVRRWVLDNALRWLRDFHLDALRLDATHEMHDDSPRHLLAQLSDEVAELAAVVGRPLALVAESDRNDPIVTTPTAEGGFGMTAQWDDDVHHALHVAFTGENQGYYGDFAAATALTTTLTAAFLHDGRWSSFRQRRWGAPVDRRRVDGRRFVVALQTHDQVGNRALGDRIHHSLSPAQHAAAAALALLAPYTPMMFMGQEWAAGTPWCFFTDFDPDEPIAGQVSAGRRAEFARHGWPAQQVPDPQEASTRHTSVVQWRELTEPAHARMLAWYRDLLALRHGEPALTDGRLDLVEVARGASWVRMTRGPVHVVVSFAGQAQAVPCPQAATMRVRLAWEPAQVELGVERVTLGPYGVAVISR